CFLSLYLLLSLLLLSFVAILRHPPCSPLFPYTTLFRSPTTKASRVLRTVSTSGNSGNAKSPSLRSNKRAAIAALYCYFASNHVGDRKSTRLNSSHVKISYAVFCLKKKNIDKTTRSKIVQ